jgi:hypothetical protein
MGKIQFSFFAALITVLGAAQLAKGQTTTFDQMNSNVGSQKAITWNTSPHSSGFGHRFISTDPGGKTTLNLQARHNTAAWSDLLVFTSDGRIGVKINNPLHSFHVYDVSQQRSRFQFANTTIDLVDYGSNPEGFSNSAELFVAGKDAIVMSSHGYNMRFVTNESGVFAERMRIRPNGNVGIGVVNPTQKLEVNGTIKTKEVNVTATGWADYVFKPDYELTSISEVERFIRENGHLPNLPSEKEVFENGVNLLEMNVKLLEKVEELTLYVIGLKKEIEELKTPQSKQP